MARPLLRTFLFSLPLLCGCAGADAGGEPESTDRQTSALSARGGYVGSFNRANQGHASKCVKLENGQAELRYPDFSPTGYSLTTAMLDAKPGADCPNGYATIDAREILETDQGRLFFFRGGYGYENAGNVKYGHLWIADLDRHVDTVKSVGNGAPCAAAKSGPHEGHYRMKVAGIPGEMHYCKTTGDCNSAAETISYEGYGDPAFDQGKNPDPGIHYTYLVWSWINVGGGGVVRSLLKNDDVFHRCDVPSIKLASVDDDGNKNGWVRAIYGKTAQGNQWIYGWTVHSHRLGGQPVVYHVEKAPELY